MIARRTLLTAGAALALLPARAAASRLSLRGSFAPGGLVISQAEAGAAIAVDGKTVSVSRDGLFAFGLPYDAEKPVRVTAAFADGADAVEEIVPVPRQYDVQRIDGLPQEYVEPPPDILERIVRERAAIRTAREADTAGSDFAAGLDWPCAGRLSGVYGSRRILNGTPMAPHLGVDIAATEGTPLCAPADGIVTIAGDYYIEGGFTLIDHGHGVSSCCLHQSQRLVKEGQLVKRGEVIGHVGMTGRATGPHCHWGVCWFQIKLDPALATKTPEPPSATTTVIPG